MLQFFWETYHTLLFVLNPIAKLDVLYKKTAIEACGFCLKYKRVKEFKRLNGILRTNLEKVKEVKDGVEPSREMILNQLAIRYEALATAAALELWQEAFNCINDVNDLLAIVKLVWGGVGWPNRMTGPRSGPARGTLWRGCEGGESECGQLPKRRAGRRPWRARWRRVTGRCRPGTGRHR